MTILGICILIVCVALAAIQVVLGARLASLFRQPAPPLLTDEECPEVVALLCLRGTDPFLPTMLQRLFAQDYPTYRVRVVIDSADDPARQVVEEVIRRSEARHVDLLVLEHHDRHCAARNSSILKGIDNLPESGRIVAMFDGDVVLHPSCLRELVSSLVREEAQAATGIRWFAPKRANLGSIVRLQWSLACSMVMYTMRLPWAGCLAISKEVVTDPEYRARVAVTFGDDMLLGSVLQRRGQKLVFVPQATIVNRETTSLRSLFNFLTRHMLYVRLSHHRWTWILGYGSLIVVMMLFVCPLGLLHPVLRPWCIAGLACLMVFSMVPMARAGQAARNAVARRSEQLIPMTPSVIVMMLAAMPVMQIFTLLANVSACLTRQITWRGLTYRFGRDPKVTLVREIPVTQVQQHNIAAVEAMAE